MQYNQTTNTFSRTYTDVSSLLGAKGDILKTAREPGSSDRNCNFDTEN